MTTETEWKWTQAASNITYRGCFRLCKVIDTKSSNYFSFSVSSWFSILISYIFYYAAYWQLERNMRAIVRVFTEVYGAIGAIRTITEVLHQLTLDSDTLTPPKEFLVNFFSSLKSPIPRKSKKQSGPIIVVKRSLQTDWKSLLQKSNTWSKAKSLAHSAHVISHLFYTAETQIILRKRINQYNIRRLQIASTDETWRHTQ